VTDAETVAEAAPVLPHLTPEFLTWLWFATERDMGSFSLPEGGRFDAWVDDRLSFRTAEDDRPRAVLTGENPSGSLEARAALAGGKLVRDLRLGLRREDREYYLVLKGGTLDFQGAKLPGMFKGTEDEALFDRMFLLEELRWLVKVLFQLFAAERSGLDWETVVLPRMRGWVAGEEG
jgi:hypothetical protein